MLEKKTRISNECSGYLYIGNFNLAVLRGFFSSAILEIEFAIIYSIFHEVCGGLQHFCHWITVCAHAFNKDITLNLQWWIIRTGKRENKNH